MSVNLLMTLKTLNRCRPQTWRNESSVSVKWKRTKSAGKEILFLKFIKNAINSGDYPPVTAPFFPQNSQCSFKEQKGKQLEGYRPPPGRHRPGRGSGRFPGNPSARPGRFGASMATEPEGRPTRSAAGTPGRRPLHSQRPQAAAACPLAPAPLAHVPGPRPTCWSHSGHNLVATFTFLARVSDKLFS